MSGVITAAVVVAGGTAYAANKSSKAQGDAADKQADSIDNAARISAEAAAEAKKEALALFNPAFADISTSLNQARGDLLSGRTSAQDILNKSFMQASNTLQTSGQQAMNAILGNVGAPQQANQMPPVPPKIPQYPTPPRLQNQGIGQPIQPPQDDIGLPPQAGENFLPFDRQNEGQQMTPFDPNNGGLRAQQIQQPINQPFAPQNTAMQQPISGLREQQALPQMQFNNDSLRGGNFQFNPMQQQF